MKKIIISAMIALTGINSYAQTIVHHYYGPYYHPYHEVHHYHHHHHDDCSAGTAAAVAIGAIGVAALASAMAENSHETNTERAALASQYESQRMAAQQNFQSGMQEGDKYFGEGNYVMALQAYARCAKSNDMYNHSLGDQYKAVDRINDCNRLLGNTTNRPSVVNNSQARQADYSKYVADVVNPVYTAKNDNNGVHITRISRNNRETRIELEYFNGNFGQTNVNVKSSTYIQGRNSGKLPLCRVENIAMAPMCTNIAYGGQVLKFALIFPPLSSDDVTFNFYQPSTDWQFKNIACL